jgi:hypothetical protein
MNLTVSANHDLDRFQALACFNIKEMQDNLYFQKYSFPDAHTTFSLCAEHYLSKQMRTRVVFRLFRMISGFDHGKDIN